MSKINKKLKHGIFFYGVANRFARYGLEFTPFYWEREFVSTCSPPQIKGAINEYSIRALNEKDIIDLHASGNAYRLPEKKRQLKNGQVCMGLLHHNEIVAYSWIEYNRVSIRNLHIELKENESYLGGMHTIKSYRGKNLAAYLRFCVYELLEEKGIDTIYSISDYFNTPAVKFKQKLNSKHLKLFLYVNLFGKFKRLFEVKKY